MNPDEQVACLNWYLAITGEALGPGTPIINKALEGYVKHIQNRSYTSADIEPVLRELLPPEIVDELGAAVYLFGSVWEALPEVSDAVVGAMMQAGAARFLYSEVPSDELG